MNVTSTANRLSDLIKKYPACIFIDTEFHTKQLMRGHRDSGVTFAIRYKGSMSITEVQGCSFASYFSSHVALVNLDGEKYHIPDCEDFEKWIELIVPMIELYAENDVWNL